MYGFLWRHLPGPAWFKVILLLALFAGIVFVLFKWGFEAIQDYMPFSNDSEVGSP